MWFKNRRSKIRKDEKMDYKAVTAGGGLSYSEENEDEGNESFEQELC